MRVEDYIISDVDRIGSLAAGTALVAYGLSRRSVGGVWLAAAAAPFVYTDREGSLPLLR